MKKERLLIIFLICLLVTLSIFWVYTNYKNGSQSEKENLLIATSFHLSEEGFSLKDIKSITINYDPLKGGELPYDAYVIFNDNSSVIEIYNWENKKRQRIVNIGNTTP